MKRLALSAAVIGACLLSCDKDDPGPQDLVTYTLEVDGEWWMFASSPDGKVLDTKQLKFNEAVALIASHPPDSFSVTIVRVQSQSPLSLDITTHTGIKPGSVFTPKVFDPEQVETPTKDGKITIEITNYPIDQKLPLIVADEYQSTSSNAGGASTRTFLMSTWQSKTPRFLITAYNGDLSHPVYKYVEGSGPGETITTDFGTFTPFEKTIDVTGFNSQHQVRVGFTMFSNLSENFTGTQFAEVGWEYSGVSPVVKVGYLDDFDSYYFDLRMSEVNEEGIPLRIDKHTHNGPLTKPLELFYNQVTVNDESMSNFDFTFSGVYQVRAQLYSYGSTHAYVSWTIYSPPGTPSVILEIPDQLLVDYAVMIPGNMQYQGSKFYSYDDGYTYEKYIQQVFTTSYGPEHAGYQQGFPKW